MNRTLLFGTRTICIRAVPKIWCSVNGPLVLGIKKNHYSYVQLRDYKYDGDDDNEDIVKNFIYLRRHACD